MRAASSRSGSRQLRGGLDEFGARGWSAMPRTRRSSTSPIAGGDGRPPQERSLIADESGRVQLGAGAGDGGPDLARRAGCDRPARRGRRRLDNPAISTPAAAPRRARRRIFAAAWPSSSPAIRRRGARGADPAARPQRSPARRAGSQHAAQRRLSGQRRSASRRSPSRVETLKADLARPSAGAASSTTSSSARWTPTASSMTACCSATRRSASPAASAPTTSRSSIRRECPSGRPARVR